MVICANVNIDSEAIREKTEQLFTDAVDRADSIVAIQNKRIAKRGSNLPPQIARLPESYSNLSITFLYKFDLKRRAWVPTDDPKSEIGIKIIGNLRHGLVSERGQSEFYWDAGVPTQIAAFYRCGAAETNYNYRLRESLQLPPGTPVVVPGSTNANA